MVNNREFAMDTSLRAFEKHLFISYARADNKTEFVSRLFDTIYEDFRGFPPSRSSVGGCIVAGRSGA